MYVYRYVCIYILIYIPIHSYVCVCMYACICPYQRLAQGQCQTAMIPVSESCSSPHTTQGDAPPSRQELSDSVALGYADLARLYRYIYMCV